MSEEDACQAVGDHSNGGVIVLHLGVAFTSRLS